MLDNVESLSSETEIAQAMREYDNEMKANKNDPKAAAARARLQRRLQLRQHQLKAESMKNELKEKIEQCEDVRTDWTLWWWYWMYLLQYRRMIFYRNILVGIVFCYYGIQTDAVFDFFDFFRLLSIFLNFFRFSFDCHSIIIRWSFDFFQDHQTDTLKLLVDVATADDNEDVAVNDMSDEDAERMLQR